MLNAASWGNVAADRDENGRHRRNLITEARGDLFFFSKEGQKRSAKRLLQRGAERVLQQTNSEIISATVYFQQFWRNVFMYRRRIFQIGNISTHISWSIIFGYLWITEHVRFHCETLENWKTNFEKLNSEICIVVCIVNLFISQICRSRAKK